MKQSSRYCVAFVLLFLSFDGTMGSVAAASSHSDLVSNLLAVSSKLAPHATTPRDAASLGASTLVQEKFFDTNMETNANTMVPPGFKFGVPFAVTAIVAITLGPAARSAINSDVSRKNQFMMVAGFMVTIFGTFMIMRLPYLLSAKFLSKSLTSVMIAALVVFAFAIGASFLDKGPFSGQKMTTGVGLAYAMFPAYAFVLLFSVYIYVYGSDIATTNEHDKMQQYTSFGISWIAMMLNLLYFLYRGYKQIHSWRHMTLDQIAADTDTVFDMFFALAAAIESSVGFYEAARGQHTNGGNCHVVDLQKVLDSTAKITCPYPAASYPDGTTCLVKCPLTIVPVTCGHFGLNGAYWDNNGRNVCQNATVVA